MSDTLERFRSDLADRYAIERELGRGGMATVFLARDIKHHRKVAIKVLRPELTSSVGIERFSREIQIGANLTHPHVLTLIDSGEAGERLYYVMPFLEGESLRERLNRDRQLPTGDALRVAGEIADALGYAHGRGVLHRDVKPENIMLSGGHAVIVDFGIARMVDDVGAEGMTVTGMAIGTPYYMSPEQFGGESDIDGRSDIYSLGCVLYEMLTGEPPFKSGSILAMIRQHMTTPVPDVRALRPSVSDGICHVVTCALGKTRDERFATCAEFTDALSLAATGQISETAVAPVVSAPTTAPSIAVLPFVNMSHDAEDDFFSDGISEELMNALGKVEGLRVVARSSAFAFKGRNEDARVIGNRLGVKTVLEGSVRRAGDQIRISAQLIDAANGYRLWSDRYDRTHGDVFAIQDDISSTIAEVLRGKLVAAEAPAAPATRDPQAYELFLKGRYEWNRRTETAVKSAVQLLDQAIERDPMFARAYAARADCYVVLGAYGLAEPKAVMMHAKADALAALELDDALAQARAAVGVVEAMYEWNWNGAEEAFRRAIELDPQHPTARQWYATNLLVPQRRFAEAAQQIFQAKQADPLSLAIDGSLGLISLYAERYDQAVSELRSTLQKDPAFAIAHYFLGMALTQVGELDDAIASFETAGRLSGNSPEIRAALGHARAIAGEDTAALALLDELKRLSEQRFVSPSLMAQIYAGLRDDDAAFELLDRGFDVRSADLVWLQVRPMFRRLHTDARFVSLLDRIGLRR